MLIHGRILCARRLKTVVLTGGAAPWVELKANHDEVKSLKVMMVWSNAWVHCDRKEGLEQDTRLLQRVES